MEKRVNVSNLISSKVRRIDLQMELNEKKCNLLYLKVNIKLMYQIYGDVKY